jgi:hypothetical protein
MVFRHALYRSLARLLQFTLKNGHNLGINSLKTLDFTGVDFQNAL